MPSSRNASRASRRRRPPEREKKKKKNRNEQQQLSIEEETETIRVVNTLLDDLEDEGEGEGEGEGLKPLRKIAVVRGLASSRLRRKCWPVLLGRTRAREKESAQLYWKLRKREEGGRGHRDSHVVTCDVERCLFQHVHKRSSLKRLLNICIAAGFGMEEKGGAREKEGEGDQQLSSKEEEEQRKHLQQLQQQDIYYYQGLHDIASVLLLVLEDEVRAFFVLQHLVVHHLRDCTRCDLIPVLESLTLVFFLLKKQDLELHDHIRSSQVPAHFALAWRLTWFSHDMKDVDQCARLFDVFIASHPLMPIYVGVAALVSNRKRILETECDFATMHQLLQSIKVTDGGLQTPVLIRKALQMYKTDPPNTLVRMRYPFEAADPLDLCHQPGLKRFGTCTSVKAYLSDAGVWCAPRQKYVPAKGKPVNKKLFNMLRTKLLGGSVGITLDGSDQTESSLPWLAMLSVSGFAVVTTATAALTIMLSFWEANLQFQLV